MPLFTDLTHDEQYELIMRTASKKKVSPTLIEKDFWVCWILKRLFSTDLAANITFKGGTSLSKCYGIINRFSEDCDITIDKDIFEKRFQSESDSLSKKQFQKLIDSTNIKAGIFVRDEISTKLEQEIQEKSLNETQWSLEIDEYDEKNLRFYYPSVLTIHETPYIKKSVLIETGIRGGIYPSENTHITSYIEEIFPDLIDIDNIAIKTLSPVRTFWEKITLLHAENNRPADKKLGDRISRHYYDIYKILQTEDIPDKAIKSLDLLYDVIDNKNKFFRSAWANYDSATPGSLNIVPNEILLEKLRKDYQEMTLMIFGEIPDFNLIIETIKNFQDSFNRESKI